MDQKYNLKSPAVKRLMREAAELNQATEDYHAQPLEDNLFEWHFTIRGARDSIFSEGVYHGRLVFPTQYPLKPPTVIMLTPNGRFQVNRRICLSISDFHPETWQPSWSIRTALLALITFMLTNSEGAVGALKYSDEERKKLALDSLKWKCPDCGSIDKILKERSSSVHLESEDLRKERELAKQITFQSSSNNPTEQETNPPLDQTSSQSNVTSSTTRTHQSETTNSTSTSSRSPSTQSTQPTVALTTLSSASQPEVMASQSSSISFQTRHPLLNRLFSSNVTLLAVLIALIALIVRRIYRVELF